MTSKPKHTSNRPQTHGGALPRVAARDDADERGITLERELKANGWFDDGRDERGRPTVRTMVDSQIERAHRVGQLSERQFTAAMKFKMHYQLGKMSGITAINFDRVFAPPSEGFDHAGKTENQVFHRNQFIKACQYLGHRNSSLVTAIVVDNKSIEDIGATFGWRSKQKAYDEAATLLRRGLNVLVNLWSL